jgi:hypothetical protein
MYFAVGSATAIVFTVQRLTSSDLGGLEMIALPPTLLLLGALIGISAEQMLPCVLVLSPEGLTVERAFAVRQIPWSQIDRVEVTTAPGSLADGVSIMAASRVGLVITCLPRDDVVRATGGSDLMVVSAWDRDANALQQVCRDVAAYRAHAQLVHRDHAPRRSVEPALAMRSFGARRTA